MWLALVMRQHCFGGAGQQGLGHQRMRAKMSGGEPLVLGKAAGELADRVGDPIEQHAAEQQMWLDDDSPRSGSGSALEHVGQARLGHRHKGDLDGR